MRVHIAVIGLLLLALVLALALAVAVFARSGSGAWRTDRVYPWEIGLLYGNRGFLRELPPGTHLRFDPFGRQTFYRVTTISGALAGHTVEVISRDQFAFRLVLTPVVTIVDPRAFVEQNRSTSPEGTVVQTEQRYDRLGPTLAAGALAAVAARTLDEFLAAPAAVIAELAQQLGPVLPGTRLDSLLLTGVTLPPEVRKMFTEVERAKREGLASLERARAEQAALRALANAARNLADNPALAQLRTLQMMENAKGAKTFVIGTKPDDLPPSRSASD